MAMSFVFRQSTAITVQMGPFLDDTTGKDEENALTIARADVRISKLGAAFAQKTETTSATFDEKAMYRVPLDATDTGTLGRIKIHIHMTGALPVWLDAMVITQSSYDAGVTTGEFDANVTKWAGTAVATPDTAGYPKTTIKDGTGAGEIALTSGKVDGVALTDAVTAYTGNTPQTADHTAAIAAIPTTMVGTDNAATSSKQNTMETTLNAVTAAGPTKAEMDTAHGLLATVTAMTAAQSDLTAILARLLTMQVQKNAAYSNFKFLMVLTSDGRTTATGLTVTGQRSIDGGAFATVSGVIAEISNGIYQFDALAADTNGDRIMWRFSAATADDAFVEFNTVS